MIYTSNGRGVLTFYWKVTFSSVEGRKRGLAGRCQTAPFAILRRNSDEG